MHKALSTIDVRRLAALAALILLGTLSSACTYATVGSGEVAVVWTPEGKKHSVYTEGEWSIGYWDKATVYNARSQEREERLRCWRPTACASSSTRCALSHRSRLGGGPRP